uniref:G-patch domain-containing protein n=2 Tax=Parascaris univalens TaxID=6257 RepID=A0A915BP47_PARUN
ELQRLRTSSSSMTNSGASQRIIEECNWPKRSIASYMPIMEVNENTEDDDRKRMKFDDCKLLTATTDEPLPCTSAAIDKSTTLTTTALSNFESERGNSEGTYDLSIADMIRDTVNEFLREFYLPGFVFNDEYQLYYNAETGYYFDQNTSLFYYPSTQCYYYYDEETNSYVFHSRVPTEQIWNIHSAKKHAVLVFGKSFTLGMSQEEVDIFECLHEMIGSIRDLDDGELETDTESEIDNTPQETDDEIQQLMQQERMEYAPCIRLIDTITSQLNIITICGAVIGESSCCDIRVDLNDISQREVVKVQYEESERAYTVSCLQNECPILINDILLGVDERRPVQHGDIWRIGQHVFVAHIHHGDNTCSGCEPGLLADAHKAVENVPTARKMSSETLRRRNVRLLKAQYGLLEDDTSKLEPAIYKGSMREKRRQPLQDPSRIRHPDDTSIYSHCEAKPRAGCSIESVVLRKKTDAPKAIDETNKGYKLLCGMGWKEGAGLGRTMSGIKEPIISEQRCGRAGLGIKEERTTSEKVKPPAKVRILQITKERFDESREISFDDVFRDNSLL